MKSGLRRVKPALPHVKSGMFNVSANRTPVQSVELTEENRP
jgi:hypothetical protein